MWPCAVANRGSVATDRETSIRRGIEVLLSLGSEEALKDGGMGVTRISEMLGREKSQVSRALKALAEYGLVERNRDALTYRLGWRIYALAQLAGEPRLLEEAGPRLRRLAIETQERAHFSVLQGTEVLTLLSESPGRAVEAVGWVGRVTPAYCTSAGAALLFDHDAAALELLFADVEFTRRARNTPADVAALHARIAHGRERGVVLASDEFEGGLVAAAAPCATPAVRSSGRSTSPRRRSGSRVRRRTSARPCWPPRRISAGPRGRQRRAAGRRRMTPKTSSSVATRSRAIRRRPVEGPDRQAQVEFVRDLRWADVPPAVRERVRLLLADLAAVCVAGRPAPASALSAAYASAVHPGDEATALLDGRRVGAVGAAWCNGVLANVLDFDDGHRLTRVTPARSSSLRRSPPPSSRTRPPRSCWSRSSSATRSRSARASRCTPATTATTPAAPGAASGPPRPRAGCSAWTQPRSTTRSASPSTTPPIAHIMRSSRSRP